MRDGATVHAFLAFSARILRGSFARIFNTNKMDHFESITECKKILNHVRITDMAIEVHASNLLRIRKILRARLMFLDKIPVVITKKPCQILILPSIPGYGNIDHKVPRLSWRLLKEKCLLPV